MTKFNYLKNNKERENYLRDDGNWECLGLIDNQDPDRHAHYLLYVQKLKNYNLIRIIINMSNQWFGEHDVVLGYYESDGNDFEQIYSLSAAQCINIMRASDVEAKNEENN